MDAYIYFGIVIVVLIAVPLSIIMGLASFLMLGLALLSLASSDWGGVGVGALGFVVFAALAGSSHASEQRKKQRKAEKANRSPPARLPPPQPPPSRPAPVPAPPQAPKPQAALKQEEYSDYDKSVFWCDRNREYRPASYFCEGHSELDRNGGRFSMRTLADRRMDNCSACRWQKNSRAVRRSQGLD